MPEQPNPLHSGVGSTPVPDPTVLTQEALRRDVNALREILTMRIDGQEAMFKTRLDAMDHAIALVQTVMDRRPIETDMKISQQHALFEERFKTVAEQFRGIEQQFIERDVRVRESAATQTTAVNAALQAAKEQNGEQYKSLTLSIDKSEKSTYEQIAQQRILLQSNYAALNDKLVALDTRTTRFESLGLGTAAARESQRADQTTHQSSNNWTLAVVLGAISVVGLVSNIIFDLLRK